MLVPSGVDEVPSCSFYYFQTPLVPQTHIIPQTHIFAKDVSFAKDVISVKYKTHYQTLDCYEPFKGLEMEDLGDEIRAFWNTRFGGSFDQEWDAVLEYDGSRDNTHTNETEIATWIKEHIHEYTKFLVRLKKLIDDYQKHEHDEPHFPILHIIVNAPTPEPYFWKDDHAQRQLEHAHVTFHLSDRIKPNSRTNCFRQCLFVGKTKVKYTVFGRFVDAFENSLIRWLNQGNRTSPRRRRVVITCFDKDELFTDLFRHLGESIQPGQFLMIQRHKKTHRVFDQAVKSTWEDPSEGMKTYTKWDSTKDMVKIMFPDWAPFEQVDQFELLFTEVWKEENYTYAQWRADFLALQKSCSQSSNQEFQANCQSVLGNIVGFSKLMKHLSKPQYSYSPSIWYIHISDDSNKKYKDIIDQLRLGLHKNGINLTSWVDVWQDDSIRPFGQDKQYRLVDWSSSSPAPTFVTKLLKRFVRKSTLGSYLYILFDCKHASYSQFRESLFEDLGSKENIHFLAPHEGTLRMWTNESFERIFQNIEVNKSSSTFHDGYVNAENAEVARYFVREAYVFTDKNLDDLILDMSRRDDNRDLLHMGRNVAFDVDMVTDTHVTFFSRGEEEEGVKASFLADNFRLEWEPSSDSTLSQAEFVSLREQIQTSPPEALTKDEQMRLADYLGKHFRDWTLSDHFVPFQKFVQKWTEYAKRGRFQFLFICCNHTVTQSHIHLERFVRKQGNNTCVIHLSEHIQVNERDSFGDCLYIPLMNDMRFYPKECQDVYNQFFTGFAKDHAYQTFFIFWDLPREQRHFPKFLLCHLAQSILRKLSEDLPTANDENVFAEMSPEEVAQARQGIKFRNKINTRSVPYIANHHFYMLQVHSLSDSCRWWQLKTSDHHLPITSTQEVNIQQMYYFPCTKIDLDWQSETLQAFFPSLFASSQHTQRQHEQMQHMIGNVFGDLSSMENNYNQTRTLLMVMKEMKDVIQEHVSEEEFQEKRKELATLTSTILFRRSLAQIAWPFCSMLSQITKRNITESTIFLYTGSKVLPLPILQETNDTFSCIFSPDDPSKREITPTISFPFTLPNLHDWVPPDASYSKSLEKNYIELLVGLIKRWLEQKKRVILFQLYEHVDSLLLANLKQSVPKSDFIVASNQCYLKRGKAEHDTHYYVWTGEIRKDEWRQLQGLSRQNALDLFPDDASPEESSLRMTDLDNLSSALLDAEWNSPMDLDGGTPVCQEVVDRVQTHKDGNDSEDDSYPVVPSNISNMILFGERIQKRKSGKQETITMYEPVQVVVQQIESSCDCMT